MTLWVIWIYVLGTLHLLTMGEYPHFVSSRRQLTQSTYHWKETNQKISKGRESVISTPWRAKALYLFDWHFYTETEANVYWKHSNQAPPCRNPSILNIHLYEEHFSYKGRSTIIVLTLPCWAQAGCLPRAPWILQTSFVPSDTPLPKRVHQDCLSLPREILPLTQPE